MLLFNLARRNVVRQWRRNALSMVSIIAGVFILVLGRGFVGGLKENIVRAQIDMVSGHVMAVPADYPTWGIQNPVDELLSLDDTTRRWLDANAEAWTTRVVFVPRAIHGRDAMRIRVTGVDADRDAAVFPREGWAVDGALPVAKDELLISRGVGRILSVGAGDTLLLETRTSAGAINAMEVKVSGVVRTNNPMYDRIGAFASMALVDDLVRPEGAFSHLAVRLDDRDDADAVADHLRGSLGAQGRVSTFAEESRDLVATQELRQRILDVLALAMMAIAATGIANTVVMAAYERVREIGTLLALGMTRAGVVVLFVTEGLLMGIAGSAIGAAAGGLLVRKFTVDGIDMSPMIEQSTSRGGYENVAFSTMLYTESSGEVVVAAMLFGLVVSVGASLYPAVFASRLQPADAVRA